ncbi:hypothetical protein SM764_07125 [Pseudophaeobacter sp. 1A16562]|uniref:ornithine cyclodeaminase family protein n=1 Tax=unclassified Pseudophaeobacter TaxID=2637024 RepID=UPI0034D4445E
MIPIYTAEDIRPHMSVADLIPSAKQAFRALSDGTATAPVQVLYPSPGADIHVKSATLAGCPIFTVKMAGWSQDLANIGAPPSSGMIVVFDSQTCRPVAILQDDHLISDYRTAAASAVVADLLVIDRAQHAVVIGTGTQARLQVEALLLVRPVTSVQVWGRDHAKAQALVDKLQAQFARVRFEVADDLEQAVRSSDVILTATGAKQPLIHADWLSPGQHITSVGSDDETKCEIDPVALSQAQVFVDARASGLAFGAPHRAIRSGLMAATDLTEIGAALKAGTCKNPERTSIACLSGLGVQDLTAVNAIWPKLLHKAPLPPQGAPISP